MMEEMKEKKIMMNIMSSGMSSRRRMSSKFVTRIPLSATIMILLFHLHTCQIMQKASLSSNPSSSSQTNSLSWLPSDSLSRILTRIKRQEIQADVPKKLIIQLTPSSSAFRPLIPMKKKKNVFKKANTTETLLAIPVTVPSFSPSSPSPKKKKEVKKPSLTVFTAIDAEAALKRSLSTTTTVKPGKKVNQTTNWSPSVTLVEPATRRSSQHLSVSINDPSDQESIQEIHLSNPPPNLYVYRPSKRRPVIPSPEEIDEIVQRLGVGRAMISSPSQPSSPPPVDVPVPNNRPPVISIPRPPPSPSVLHPHSSQVNRPPPQTLSSSASSAPSSTLTTDDIAKPAVVPIESIGKDVEVALQKIIDDLLDRKHFFSIPQNSIYDANKLISGKFSGKLSPAPSFEASTPSATNSYDRQSFKEYSKEQSWNSKPYGFPRRPQDQGSHVALFADHRPRFRESQREYFFPHGIRPPLSPSPPSLPPAFNAFSHGNSLYPPGNERFAGNELKPYYTTAKSALGPGLRSFASYVKV